MIICARETERFDRVLENGWSRMDNSPAAEKAFALIEIAKIANYRFSDLVADANPIAAARFSRLNELPVDADARARSHWVSTDSTG